jgi:hypothetical protein
MRNPRCSREARPISALLGLDQMSKLENRHRPRAYRIHSVLVSQFIIWLIELDYLDLLVVIILVFNSCVVFMLDVC